MKNNQQPEKTDLVGTILFLTAFAVAASVFFPEKDAQPPSPPNPPNLQDEGLKTVHVDPKEQFSSLEENLITALQPERALLEKISSWIDRQEMPQQIAPEPPVAPIWFESLSQALQDQDTNGGVLAIIVGTDEIECPYCDMRLQEAKALEVSPYKWVYTTSSDPILTKRLGKLPSQTFPQFILMSNGFHIKGVPPESLGLKPNSQLPK